MSKKKSMSEMLDEFRGQGGSYVVDPATGQRKLQERTQSAEEAEIEQKKEQGNATA